MREPIYAISSTPARAQRGRQGRLGAAVFVYARVVWEANPNDKPRGRQIA